MTAIEKIWVSIEAEINTASFEKSSTQILKYARDTKKALDPELYLKLELDVAKLQSQLANAKTILTQAKKTWDSDLVFRAQIDTNRLQDWLTQAKGEFRNFKNTWDQNISRLQTKFNQLWDEVKKTWLDFKWLWDTIIGAGIIAWVQWLSNGVITLAWNLQQARIAFSTMIGSATEAEVLLKSLSDFAKKTPFELTGLIEQAKLLLAYWYNADEIIPTLESLWNISAWVWVDKLPRLTYALWQVRAAWKLTGQDFRQFTETGVALWAELEKITWKTNINSATVSDLWITYEQVQQALSNLWWEGGKFGWLMEAQSQTLQWSFSNLKDSLNILWEQVGVVFIPALTSIVKWINTVVEWFANLSKTSPILSNALSLITGAFGLLILWFGGYLAIAPILTAANVAMFASFWALLWPIGLVAWAIGVLSFWIDIYNKKQEQIQWTNLAAWRSLFDVWEEIKTVQKKLADLNDMLSKWKISQEEYNKQTQELTSELDNLQKAQLYTTNSTEDLNKVLWVLNDTAINTDEDRKQLLELAKVAEEATAKVLALARAKLESFALTSKTWKADLERKQTAEWKRSLVWWWAVADNTLLFTDSLDTIIQDNKELEKINKDISESEKLLKDFAKAEERIKSSASVKSTIKTATTASWWGSSWGSGKSSSTKDTSAADAIKAEIEAKKAEEEQDKRLAKFKEERFKIIEEKWKAAFDSLTSNIKKSTDEVAKLQDKLAWVEDQLAWVDESIANRILTIEEQLRTADGDKRIKLEEELALAKANIDATTLQTARDEAAKSETQKLLDKKLALENEMTAIQENIDAELQAQKDLADAKIKLEELLTDKYKIELQKREWLLQQSVTRQIALISSIPAVWWSSVSSSTVTNNNKNTTINANINNTTDATSLFRKISQ